MSEPAGGPYHLGSMDNVGRDPAYVELLNRPIKVPDLKAVAEVVRHATTGLEDFLAAISYAQNPAEYQGFPLMSLGDFVECLKFRRTADGGREYPGQIVRITTRDRAVRVGVGGYYRKVHLP